MQAIILAGGLGTRLRPLTKTIPKCMIPIKNKPFLEYLITFCKNQGIKDIILSVGYLQSQIINYFGNGKMFCVNLSYSKEKKLLGTGGAMKHALPFITDSDFIVLNGDTFLEVDIQKIYNFHKSKKALITLALIKVKDASRYGAVEINKKCLITKFTEKDPKTKNQIKYVNGGVCIVNSSIFKSISNGIVSFEREILQKYIGKIYGIPIKGYFIDIGTYSSLRQINKDFKKIQNILQLPPKNARK